ncbi:MAG: S8 family peptidase [Gemmatimonadales bacterium]
MSHFWIPPDRIQVERFVPPAGGRPIEREDFGAHGRALFAQYQAAREVILQKDDAELTQDVIVQVTTPPDIPVRQEKQRLQSLGFKVLSYSPRAENRASTLIARGSFDQLQQRLHRYAEAPNHPGKSYLAVIEELSDVPAEDKIDPAVLQLGAESPVNCLVTIYAALPTPDKVAIAQALSRRLSAAPRSATRIRSFINDTFALAAWLTADEALDLAARYASIRSIRVNGRAVISKSVLVSALPTGLRVDPAESSIPVVVVDSGIRAAMGPLSGLVVAHRHHLPTGSVCPEFSHGTFVASRLAFGDAIEASLATGLLVPRCPLIDVAVFGVDAAGSILGPDEDDLIDVITKVVQEFRGQTKIFNLSLGLNSPTQDGSFTELAKNLDFLARENDVLFVIAAGNIDSPAAAHPDHFLHPSARIQPPAESLLSVSVGALARHATAGALAAVGEVSPFSCRGPGADLGQKPELVAHGGNLLATWRTTPRIATYGLAASGTDLAYDVGTSFAAPLVAQVAARLAVEYPSASCNLLKALLCHFAEPASCPSLLGIESRHLAGLGNPELDRALNAGPSSVAYLHEGTLQVNSYLHIPFYIPGTLAENTGRLLTVRATLVYNPPVDPDNSDEYSQARVSCSLYKRVDVGFRQVTVSASEGAVSRPWNPLIYFEKAFRRQYATGDWELRLRLMTRGGLPADFRQHFAVVIEVIDASGSTDVRRDVLAENPQAVKAVVLRAAA